MRIIILFDAVRNLLALFLRLHAASTLTCARCGGGRCRLSLYCLPPCGITVTASYKRHNAVGGRRTNGHRGGLWPANIGMTFSLAARAAAPRYRLIIFAHLLPCVCLALSYCAFFDANTRVRVCPRVRFCLLPFPCAKHRDCSYFTCHHDR